MVDRLIPRPFIQHPVIDCSRYAVYFKQSWTRGGETKCGVSILYCHLHGCRVQLRVRVWTQSNLPGLYKLFTGHVSSKLYQALSVRWHKFMPCSVSLDHGSLRLRSMLRLSRNSPHHWATQFHFTVNNLQVWEPDRLTSTMWLEVLHDFRSAASSQPSDLHTAGEERVSSHPCTTHDSWEKNFWQI